MSSVGSDSDGRAGDRVQLDRKVHLRFEKFQQFLTEIAGNISPGGMFVRSDDPHEAGEQFEFECSLADGYPLVSGKAEVVWTRRLSPSVDQPTGMGVRFLELRDKSEMLIRRIVEQRKKAGQKTFELEVGLSDGELDTEREVRSLSKETPAADPSSVVEAPEEPKPEVGASKGEQPPISPAAPNPSGPSLFPKTPSPPKSEPKSPSLALDAPNSAPLPAPSAAAEASSRPKAPPPSARPPKPVARTASTARAAGTQATRQPARAHEPRAGSKAGASARSAPPGSSRKGGKRLGVLRFIELLVLSTSVGAFMVLVFNQYWVRPRIDRLEAQLEELTGNSSVGGPPGFAWAERNPPADPETTGDGGAEGEEGKVEVKADGGEREDKGGAAVEPAALDNAVAAEFRQPPQEAVQGWARAWSEQRVDDYLSYYAADFVPASGVPRAVWEDRRRNRLLGQGAIRVTMVSFSIEELAPDEARVMFTQSFQSNVYRDRVRKALRMSWLDDRWQITEEVVIRQLPW